MPYIDMKVYKETPDISINDTTRYLVGELLVVFSFPGLKLSFTKESLLCFAQSVEKGLLLLEQHLEANPDSRRSMF